MSKILFNFSLLSLLLAVVSTAHAQNVGEEVFEVNRYSSVYCNQGQSIQHAVDRANSGQTRGGTVVILVWGTCHEAVLIQSDNVNIIGREAAGTKFGDEAIIMPPAGAAAFTVRHADNVFIGDFKIVGGGRGVEVTAGGGVEVRNNEILDSTNVGIIVELGSFAGIYDNVLASTSGNFSQVFLANASSADIHGNTISASSGTGVTVTGASGAIASGNDISGTDRAAMLVAQNANIFLRGANTLSNPGGAAIVCGVSGSLRVNANQNVLSGGVVLNPGCDVSTAGGVIFP